MPRHLFIDDTWMLRSENLPRVPHRAQKHPANPILTRDHPWEAERVQVYGNSVLYDKKAGLFRMYYLAWPTLDNSRPLDEFRGVKIPTVTTLAAYAESKDGINWTKPSLKQCTYNGSTENNLLDLQYGQSFEPGVLLDEADPDPQRRYKIIFWDQRCQMTPPGHLKYLPDLLGDGRVWVENDAGEVIWEEPYNLDFQKFGLYAGTSPDGIHWRRHPATPLLPCYSDTGHSLLRDPDSGRFVVFGRLRFHPGSPEFNIGRSVARMTSDDFEHWSEPQLVLCGDADDPPVFHINSMPISIYEGMYVGLVEVGDGRKPPERPTGPMQLACSRDGIHWDRVADRAPFLDTDDPDDWDHGGHIKPGSGLIVRDDQVYMYYGGAPRGEFLTGIALATWRRDGFVSLHADAAGGTLVTRPFVLDGNELHLNLDAANGQAVVTVGDEQGRRPGNDPCQWPVSKPVTGDQTDHRVAWQSGDLGTCYGRIITLRIDLHNADLYSYWTDKP